jgi:hypothetical protein
MVIALRSCVKRPLDGLEEEEEEEKKKKKKKTLNHQNA